MKLQKLFFNLLASVLAILMATDMQAQVNKVWFYAGNWNRTGYSGDTYLAHDASKWNPTTLKNPNAIACDPQGNLYIADDNAVIRKVDAVTHIITTFAGNGISSLTVPSHMGATGPGGPSQSDSLGFITSMVYNAADNCLYVGMGAKPFIFKINIATNQITPIAGNPAIQSAAPTDNIHAYTYTGDGGPALSANFYQVNGLALSRNGRYLYASDYAAGVVRRIDLSTNIITTFAGNNLANTTQGVLSGVSATATTLVRPMGLAVDASDNVYIFCSGPFNVNVSNDQCGSISKVNPATGIITRVAGTDFLANTTATRADNIQATGAYMYQYISNMLVDANNNLIFCDRTPVAQGTSVVRKINLATGIISTLVGDRSIPATSSMDGWPALSGGVMFTQASGIAISPSGLMYVADNGVDVVYQVSPAAPVNPIIVPPVAGAGTINCAATQLYPAPVAGTPRQIDLVVTVNVTTAGCFSPITVSGSGFSLPAGLTQKCVTATGIQQLHIPVNYDGTALGTLNFTIGQAGACSADLTRPPSRREVNVWTLDNCTLVNVAPALR